MAGKSIFAGQDGEGVSAQNKKYAEEAYADAAKQLRTTARVPVNQIEEDIVPLSDGTKKKIYPKRTAQRVNYAISLALSMQDFSFLKPYLEKPIIWTYEAKTAFTDGIRIFMSPLFATTLLSLGKKDADTFANANPLVGNYSAADERQYTTKVNLTAAKYILFVIVHECYHVLYQHVKRERLLIGKDAAKHSLANIAADLEINRDIESCFESLRGSTVAIGGVWYKDPKFKNYDVSNGGKIFLREVFEDILRWMIEHNVLPPDEALDSPFNDNNDADNLAGSIYKQGWDKSIDAIQKGLINPEDITFV